MGISIGSSDSSSTTKFSEGFEENQLPYLQDLWGSGMDLYGMGMGYNPLMFSGGANLMGSMDQMYPAWGNLMTGGSYAGLDVTNDYNTAFSNLMNPSSYTQDIYADIMGGEGNSYAEALESELRSNQQETLGQSLAMLDQRAGLMSGSSTWENAMADIISDSNAELDTTLAGIGYDTFDKDLKQKLDIAKMADANWMTGATRAMDAAEGSLGGVNATMGGGLTFGSDMFNAGMQQYMAPFMASLMMSQFMPPAIVGSSKSSSSSGGMGFSL
jgi:hypothetical protein